MVSAQEGIADLDEGWQRTLNDGFRVQQQEAETVFGDSANRLVEELVNFAKKTEMPELVFRQIINKSFVQTWVSEDDNGTKERE